MFRFGDPGGRMYTVPGVSGANILALWSSAVAIGSWSVAAGQGRIVGSCLRYLTNQFGSLVKNLDAQPTLGIAFAYRQSGPQIGAMPIVSFTDAGTNQIDLRVNNDGSLTVTRNGTALGSAAAAVPTTTWVHIELRVTFHPSVGTVFLSVNGTTRLNLTNLNTRNTANSFANQVGIGCFGNLTNTLNLDFDDVIVYDGQPVDLNGLTDIIGPIGDCTLRWLLPNGGGSVTQWSPDSGANYQRVWDTTPDGDTSYVFSSSLNAIDTYTMADLPAGSTFIKSMAVVCYARKTDATIRAIAGMIKTNGVLYGNVSLAPLSTSYTYNFFAWGANPNTGAPWLTSDINALEAGQKVTT